MKQLIRAAIIVVFLIFPGIAAASFLIQLKDGKEFITDRYWEEGNQIKFNYYGGVVGVPKDSVRKIEKTNAPVKTAPETPNETQTSERTEQIDIESYKEKRLELERRLEEASERHRAAIKNQDLAGKEKTIQEMREISGQAIDLADELKQKNKGVLPDWWKERSR